MPGASASLGALVQVYSTRRSSPRAGSIQSTPVTSLTVWWGSGSNARPVRPGIAPSPAGRREQWLRRKRSERRETGARAVEDERPSDVLDVSRPLEARGDVGLERVQRDQPRGVPPLPAEVEPGPQRPAPLLDHQRRGPGLRTDRAVERLLGEHPELGGFRGALGMRPAGTPLSRYPDVPPGRL